jgi:predicted nucleic acid-binding protein
MLLLDVNALLALRYIVHVHHERVHQWVSQLATHHGYDHAAFATCPITELGFLRVGSGKAAYAKDLPTARDDLQDLKSSMGMRFISDDLPTHYLPTWVRKSAQTTDGYLLALARSRGGCLATLDGFIPGSMFIPEETTGPLMVRERTCSTLPYSALWSGSRGIELR